MTTTFTASPASSAQMSYLASLLESRLVPEAVSALDTEHLTKAEASNAISLLVASPWKKPATLVDLGYYVVDGTTVYVVVETKDKQRRYAKRLVRPTRPHKKARWDYAAGAMAVLTGMTPFTLEEAAKFGHLHGWCLACGVQLTDPKSVQQGIGPVCIKKFGGAK